MPGLLPHGLGRTGQCGAILEAPRGAVGGVHDLGGHGGQLCGRSSAARWGLIAGARPIAQVVTVHDQQRLSVSIAQWVKACQAVSSPAAEVQDSCSMALHVSPG